VFTSSYALWVGSERFCQRVTAELSAVVEMSAVKPSSLATEFVQPHS